MMAEQKKASTLKIGVVGTFICDHTVPYRGQPYDSLGGIFYSLAILGALAQDDVEIVPVARVGHDIYDQVLETMRLYPRVSCDHLIRSDHANTRVELRYVSEYERTETTTERMAPLEWPEVQVLADCDAILVNMITGTDLSLAALRNLAAAGRAWIYLDFHSLAYAIDEDGRRRLQRPPDWHEWLECAGGVQVNEAEAAVLAGSPSSEAAVTEFGERVTAEMVDVCNVTAGARGSHLFWRENGRVRYAWISAVRLPRVVDVVGCGDAFAAGFVFTYARTGDALEAARQANRTAAANCTYPGTSGVRELRRTLLQLGQGEVSG